MYFHIMLTRLQQLMCMSPHCTCVDQMLVQWWLIRLRKYKCVAPSAQFLVIVWSYMEQIRSEEESTSHSTFCTIRKTDIPNIRVSMLTRVICDTCFVYRESTHRTYAQKIVSKAGQCYDHFDQTCRWRHVRRASQHKALLICRTSSICLFSPVSYDYETSVVCYPSSSREMNISKKKGVWCELIRSGQWGSSVEWMSI